MNKCLLLADDENVRRHLTSGSEQASRLVYCRMSCLVTLVLLLCSAGDPKWTPKSFNHEDEAEIRKYVWLSTVAGSDLWADCRSDEAAGSPSGLQQLLQQLKSAGIPRSAAAASALDVVPPWAPCTCVPCAIPVPPASAAAAAVGGAGAVAVARPTSAAARRPAHAPLPDAAGEPPSRGSQAGNCNDCLLGAACPDVKCDRVHPGQLCKHGEDILGGAMCPTIEQRHRDSGRSLHAGRCTRCRFGLRCRNGLDCKFVHPGQYCAHGFDVLAGDIDNCGRRPGSAAAASAADP